MATPTKVSQIINSSNYLSRDLSWLTFNYRVLDQARHLDRTVFERLKFLAITAGNLEEFFMIRLGSLYNYLDYGRERVDYSGLREVPFKRKLMEELQTFVAEQNALYLGKLKPQFEENGFVIANINDLHEEELEHLKEYFTHTVYPMLTPMVFDSYHTFPILMNQLQILGVVTKSPDDKKDKKKLSFIQIPANLPRFVELERPDKLVFVPIEQVIQKHIHWLFRNIELVSVNLFRITRNGDFTLDESDDIETNFLEEMRRKLKTRKTGRVVRIEVLGEYDKWMMRLLKARWELEDDNIFKVAQNSMLDFTGLWQIVNHREFKSKVPSMPEPVPALTIPEGSTETIFDVLEERDVLMHHPYNSIDPLLDLLEAAADDAKVLSIKLTIYRLAKDSRITAALLKAAENGKHVSVLFEVKARFDEENNMREAARLREAGCFVIYGISSLKTHTKLMLIVRKVGSTVTRYVHMSSGNYNESTSRIYEDIGLLSTNESYAHDISEFFNVITGHSTPSGYKYLLTAPRDMRNQLLALVKQEAQNAQQGLPSGICIKINSLEDRETIDELYAASQAGVPIKLIVRGICCLRPGRKGLSENITVRSIVGDYLEHSRLFYFHNNGDPKIYGGSADVMVRSFDRRLESLFLIVDDTTKNMAAMILDWNLKDNVNSYDLMEDGSYVVAEQFGEEAFNVHREFFKLTHENAYMPALFEQAVPNPS